VEYALACSHVSSNSPGWHTGLGQVLKTWTFWRDRAWQRGQSVASAADLARFFLLKSRIYALVLVLLLGETQFKFIGEKMMTHNANVETQHTATLIDRLERLEDAAADCDSVAGLMETPYLTNWPTQHMTATWGN